MSLSTNNHNPHQSDNTIMDLLDREKGSDWVSYTFYGYILFFLALISISFFYYAFSPQEGFFYLFWAICIIVMAFGFKSFDLVSAILLFSISTILSVFFITTGLIFTDPILILYYVLFLLLCYTLFFDKRSQLFFRFKFNQNFKFFYIVILGQYAYLMLLGFLDLDLYATAPAIDLILFYSFITIVAVNLILVQAKFYNARILMFFTSTAVIIYSLFTLFTDPLAVPGLILNIATILFLIFDKRVVSQFTQAKFESRIILRITVIVNLISVVLGFIGALYLYSITYELWILLFGLGFSIFYLICIYQVNKYSTIWKYIMSAFMVILLGAALYFGESFITFSLIFGPVSFLTIFVLNFNYQTRNLFQHALDIEEIDRISEF